MNLKKLQDKAASIAPSFFLILLFLIAIFKSVYKIRRSFDIRLADETHMLEGGLSFSIGDIFSEFGVYKLWYKFLSLFISDPVNLYVYNYAALLCLNGILILIYLSQKKKFGLGPVLISIAFLSYPLHIHSHPNASRLSLAATLVCLILCSLQRKQINRYMLVYIGALTLLYIRVQHMLTVSLMLVFAAYCLFRSMQTKNKRHILLHALFICLLAFFVSSKNPGSTGRSIGAFATWYSYNLTLQNIEIEGNPWYEWDIAFKKNFGESKNLLEAFIENTPEFLSHMSFNFFLLQKKFVNDPYFMLLLLLLIAVFLFKAAVPKKTESAALRHAIRNKLQRLNEYPEAALVICITITSLSSALIMQPSEPYILLLTGLFFTFCGLPISESLRLKIGSRAKLLWLFLFVWMAASFLPWNMAGGRRSLTPGAPRKLSPCSTRNKLAFLRKLPWEAGYVHMLYNANPNIYLNNDKNVLFSSDYFHIKDRPFDEFLAKKKFGLIHVDQYILGHSQYKSDAFFQSFIKNHEDHGYIKYKIKACKEYWLIHKKHISI